MDIFKMADPDNKEVIEDESCDCDDVDQEEDTGEDTNVEDYGHD